MEKSTKRQPSGLTAIKSLNNCISALMLLKLVTKEEAEKLLEIKENAKTKWLDVNL